MTFQEIIAYCVDNNMSIGKIYGSHFCAVKKDSGYLCLKDVGSHIKGITYDKDIGMFVVFQDWDDKAQDNG